MPPGLNSFPPYKDTREAQRDYNAPTLHKLAISTEQQSSVFRHHCSVNISTPRLMSHSLTGDGNREKMEQEGLVLRPLSHYIHCRIEVFSDDRKTTELRAGSLLMTGF